MWSDINKDPGGSSGKDPPVHPPSSQELADLKDQFQQQQILISQLKEMLRKNEQTVVTQEKVEEYANTLTKMNARAKKYKLKKESNTQSKSDTTGPVDTQKHIDTPTKEKINLLRQQMEENK